MPTTMARAITIQVGITEVTLSMSPIAVDATNVTRKRRQPSRVAELRGREEPIMAGMRATIEQRRHCREAVATGVEHAQSRSSA